jgi:hypothetical protein
MMIIRENNIEIKYVYINPLYMYIVKGARLQSGTETEHWLNRYIQGHLY